VHTCLVAEIIDIKAMCQPSCPGTHPAKISFYSARADMTVTSAAMPTTATATAIATNATTTTSRRPATTQTVALPLVAE